MAGPLKTRSSVLGHSLNFHRPDFTYFFTEKKKLFLYTPLLKKNNFPIFKYLSIEGCPNLKILATPLSLDFRHIYVLDFFYQV